MTAIADASEVRRTHRAFRPSPRLRLVSWAIENIVNEERRPYDHAAYPHIGAPGGPADAFDDPRCRTIALQFATRLAKTFFSQCCLLYTADVNPAPTMHGNTVEKLAKEVVARIYKMIHSRPRLNRKLLNIPKYQRQDRIIFRESELFVAWSRSVSTLADKNCKVGHAGEYDKWDQASTSKEADPRKLFDDRFKDYQSTRKVIYESTPTVKGRSPIEARRIAGTDCRLDVPCPHCRRYQRLEMGNDEPWGVKWEKNESGDSDPATAYLTAHYVCRHCTGRIDDHHRPWMIRRGVWCPNGADVDGVEALRVTEANIAAGEPAHEWRGWRHCRWIRGHPRHDGQDASYQLSSLYALSLGWGDVAKEFVSCRNRPQELRNFVNQWLGETWQVRGTRHDWQVLGDRLNGGYSLGSVPDNCGLLTIGIDVQDTYFVYALVGWAPDDIGYLIDWGDVETWGELKKTVLARRYGGGNLAPLPIAMGGMDSGHRTDEVYGYCREIGDSLRPTKGFDSLEKPIIASSLDDARSETRKALAQRHRMYLWKFNKPYWQEEFQRRLDNFKAHEPGSLTLPIEAAKSQDFMMQVTNNAPQENAKGRVIWGKTHPSDPDDIRDALIIARVVKEMWTRGNEGRIRLAATGRDRPPQPAQKRPTEPATSPLQMFQRPGGWIEGMR